ncbi:MAG: hypothetical protein AB8G22_06630 [Saprospiraceae bacterium]
MNVNKNKTNPYQTVLVICIGLVILHWWSQWNWALMAAIVIGLLSIISPFIAKKIDLLWMKLAYVLSLFVPNILLSVVYFLLLVPIALLARIFGGKDALQLKKQDSSTFKNRKVTFTAADFEKPW